MVYSELMTSYFWDVIIRFSWTLKAPHLMVSRREQSSGKDCVGIGNLDQSVEWQQWQAACLHTAAKLAHSSCKRETSNQLWHDFDNSCVIKLKTIIALLKILSHSHSHSFILMHSKYFLWFIFLKINNTV